MSLLIRNGTIVTASDMYQGDVLVEVDPRDLQVALAKAEADLAEARAAAGVPALIIDGGSKTFSSDRLSTGFEVTFGHLVEAP